MFYTWCFGVYESCGNLLSLLSTSLTPVASHGRTDLNEQTTGNLFWFDSICASAVIDALDNPASCTQEAENISYSKET